MVDMEKERKYVIALGTFDGLHPGHRAVLNACMALAEELGAESMVYTFIENPRSLFGKAPLALMTPREKQEKLLSMGIGRVEAAHFTVELASLSPVEFLEKLTQAYHPAGFVCGEDYTFGKNAAGTSALLARYGGEHGIKTLIVPTVTVRGSDEKISSSLIREALEKGDTDKAKRLLEGTEL